MNCGIHKMRWQGYFHSEQRQVRRWAWARAMDALDGKEYDCQVDIRRIVNQQPKSPKEIANRFFAVKENGDILLCECHWTKAEIDRARKRAHKIGLFFNKKVGK